MCNKTGDTSTLYRTYSNTTTTKSTFKKHRFVFRNFSTQPPYQNLAPINQSNMKTAFVSLLAVGSASAFAPVQTSQRASVSVAASIDGMIGVDIETGKKFVSHAVV